MASENEFLLHALIMGIFITFVYDILRIFRRVVPHGGFLVSLEDLVFWIYCAAEVFLMMYHESDGNLRWFAVIGALIGMLLYKKLVSPRFVKYVSLWLGKVFQILGKVLNLLFKPFRMAKAKGKALTKSATNRFHRLMLNSKKRLKMRLTFFLKMLKMTL